MASINRTRRLLIACVVAAVATQNVSAQLLRLSPLSLLKPLLTSSTTTATCNPGPLSASSKVDAAIQHWAGTEATGTLQVIVSAGDGALLATVDLVLALGGALLGTLPGVNAVVARVDLPDLTALVCAADVASISLDAPVKATTAQPLPYSLRASLGLPVNTPAGSNVTVAVVDSGIAPSADLAARIVGFFDMTRGALPASPSDAYGHGTHVAGLIASAGSLPGGALYQGIAPQVRLLGMKVLDGTGAGRTSDVIRAVELITLLRPLLGVDVINLSLGHPIYEPASRDPLVRAVESASRAGIVVVAAAGNDGYNRATGETGYGGINSPGNAPSAITVAASMTQDTNRRSDDRIAPFSSRGPSWYDGISKPDLAAPGYRLVSNAAPGSTLSLTYPAAQVTADYLRLSGTSMATAVVSGAVALVLEAHRRAQPDAPPLTPNLVKGILQYSSTRLRDESGREYDELTQGAGALNAAGAMKLAAAIDTRQPRGAYWLTETVVPSTTLLEETLAWAQRLIWRTQTLWGPAFDRSEVAWALNTVWGAPNVAGSHFVWGTHIVWGTDTVWGDDAPAWPNHVVWGTNMVGATDDGDHIVWGTTDHPDSTVWGNVASTEQGSAKR